MCFQVIYSVFTFSVYFLPKMGSLSRKEWDRYRLFVNHCHALFLCSLCRVFTSKCNFGKTSLSFLNYTEKQFTLYSYDFYMFSSSMNHLVQSGGILNMFYVQCCVQLFRPPKTLLGSRRLWEGSTLLGYLYRSLNFHKQIHSLS